MSSAEAESCPRHFLLYLTANDDPQYWADCLNFRDMARFHPGVGQLEIQVCVSLVTPRSARDRAAVAALVEIATDCPWMKVLGVTWKGNLGRDFSSAEAAMQAIAAQATPRDIVMVRNRSAYGPFFANWYRAYTDQFRSFDRIGLVGSTINFAGHPLRPDPRQSTHVQTYVYLTQWKHLEWMVGRFPGARCDDRLDLIAEGEIGLSRGIMTKGLFLTCLNWPKHRFSQDIPVDPNLPQGDIKSLTVNLPLRYRFPSHLRGPLKDWRRFIWLLRLQLRVIFASTRTTTAPETTLSCYDEPR